MLFCCSTIRSPYCSFHALKELVASEVVAGKPLLLAQNLLDLDLGRDARMVNTGKPHRGVALHTLIARQNILERCVQRVTHMELAGDVRGRHNDGEGLLALVYNALEITAFHPHIVNLFLDRFRVISLGEFFHVLCTLLKK